MLQEICVSQELDVRLNEVRGRLRSLRDDWAGPRETSKDQLYRLLGAIWEAGHELADVERSQEALIASINKQRDSKMRPYKRNSRTTIFSLLLLDAFGNDDFESSRSQWLKAFKVAENELVKTVDQGLVGLSASEFIDWLKKVGGIVKAGRIARDGRDTVRKRQESVLRSYRSTKDELARSPLVDFTPTETEEDGEELFVIIAARQKDGKIAIHDEIHSIAFTAQAISYKDRQQ